MGYCSAFGTPRKQDGDIETAEEAVEGVFLGGRILMKEMKRYRTRIEDGVHAASVL